MCWSFVLHRLHILRLEVSYLTGSMFYVCKFCSYRLHIFHVEVLSPTATHFMCKSFVPHSCTFMCRCFSTYCLRFSLTGSTFNMWSFFSHRLHILCIEVSSFTACTFYLQRYLTSQAAYFMYASFVPHRLHIVHVEVLSPQLHFMCVWVCVFINFFPNEKFWTLPNWKSLQTTIWNGMKMAKSSTNG